MGPRRGGGGGGTANNGGLQWLRHPLLSSVVWFLGGSTPPRETDYDVDSLGSQQTSRQRLSWSDEHGKSLTEILGGDDSEASMHLSSSDTLPDSALKASRKSGEGGGGGGKDGKGQAEERTPEPALPAFDRNSDDHLVDEDEDFIICPDNKSPQWGWYVTMTPPQEQYASSSHVHAEHAVNMANYAALHRTALGGAITARSLYK